MQEQDSKRDQYANGPMTENARTGENPSAGRDTPAGESSEMSGGSAAECASAEKKALEVPHRPFTPKRFLNTPLRWIVLLFFLGLTGLIVFGSKEAHQTSSNRVIDWFPSSFQETQKCQWFWANFGTSDYLMVSWDGLSTHDEVQDMLARRLLESPGEDAQGEPLPPYFQRVMTTRTLLEELEKTIRNAYEAQNLEPPKKPSEIARDRLAGWLISRDGQEGCVVAMMSPAGRADRKAALEQVYHDAMLLTGKTHQEIHVAGASCDSVAIDDASAKSTNTLVPIFCSVCLVLLVLCLRNLILTFSVFFIAVINQELGPALIYYTGSHMDSVSLLISALVFVLTTECGIHLANYYRDAILEHGSRGAVVEAIRKGWLPCFLATFTTALGMGSLMISQVVPIRNFGIYSSLTLCLGSALLFLILPAVWENWYPFRYSIFEVPKDANGEVILTSVDFASRFWNWLVQKIARFYPAVIVLALVLMGCFAPFVRSLKTTVTLHGMLPDTNEVIVDYNYLEKKVGGLVSLEIVLRIPEAGNEKRSLLEECKLVRLVENAVNQVDGADGSLTLLTFLPDLPELQKRGVGATLVRRRTNTLMEENIQRLKDSGYFCAAPKEHLWRISLHVPAWRDLDYEPLLKKLEVVVYETLLNAGVQCRFTEAQLAEAPHLQAIAQQFSQQHAQQKQHAQQTETDQATGAPVLPFQNVSTVVTGAIPLVFQAQKQLLRDLIDSFFMAFGLITLTMICLLGGLRAGLIAMIPNILPSIVVFGIFACLGLAVDIGSMMTASVALGITVDGTLHFLTWFKRGIYEGNDRRHAVIYAYTHCASAMLETAFICSFAFLVFCFSGFMPVARFAWMLCILLTVAVIADLLLTPSLLLSPLGHVFVPRKLRKTVR